MIKREKKGKKLISKINLFFQELFERAILDHISSVHKTIKTLFVATVTDCYKPASSPYFTSQGRFPVSNHLNAEQRKFW